MGLTIGGGSALGAGVSADTLTGLTGMLNNMAQEQPEFEVVVDAGKVYIDVQAKGGGDIHPWLDYVLRTLDCTSVDNLGDFATDPETGLPSATMRKARIEIPQGTAEIAKYSEIYAFYSDQAGKVMLAVSDIVPIGSNSIKLSYQSIRTHADVTAHLPDGMQRTTQITNTLFDRMLMKDRKGSGGASHDAGIHPFMVFTSNASTMDGLRVAFTSGMASQANPQIVPALDVAVDGFYVLGVSGNGNLKNYQQIFDINEILEDGVGNALADGDSLFLDFHLNVNYSPDMCKMYVHPTLNKFTDDIACKQSAKGWRNQQILPQYKGVGIWISRIAYRYNSANGGTLTNIFTDSQLVWKEQSLAPAVNTVNYPDNYLSSHDYVYYQDSGTAHSYIDIPAPAGTTRMQLFHEAFNLETGYDYWEIYDGNTNALLDRFDNNRGAFWTPIYNTNKLRVRVNVDTSVSRSGTRAIKMAYEYLETITNAEFIDLIE